MTIRRYPWLWISLGLLGTGAGAAGCSGGDSSLGLSGSTGVAGTASGAAGVVEGSSGKAGATGSSGGSPGTSAGGATGGTGATAGGSAAGAAGAAGGSAGSSAGGTTGGAGGVTGSSVGGATGTTGGGTASSSGSGAGGCGLPADVQTMLQTYCVSCHSAPPVGGAPMALETYADLLAPSTISGQSVAQRSLSRLQSSATPMPPLGSPRPSDAQVTAFEAWVDSGAEQAACGTSGATAGSTSGATTGTSGATAGSTSGATAGSASGSSGEDPAICTSNVYWTGQTGPNMDPGDTCPSCHNSFQIAGTVYPTAHEATDCDGVTGSNLSVVITDAKGTVQTLAVDAVGNFYSTAAIAMPFHAKVVSKTTERDMVAAQTSGDCNLCHSVDGLNGAPGRILSP